MDKETKGATNEMKDSDAAREEVYIYIYAAAEE